MGPLTVRHSETRKQHFKSYARVYAKTKNELKFFKDGYTDLRGEFDYVSVSSMGLSQIRKFSILVMNEQNLATVMDSGVPQR